MGQIRRKLHGKALDKCEKRSQNEKGTDVNFEKAEGKYLHYVQEATITNPKHDTQENSLFAKSSSVVLRLRCKKH